MKTVHYEIYEVKLSGFICFSCVLQFFVIIFIYPINEKVKTPVKKILFV